jgi:hypothetical protein
MLRDRFASGARRVRREVERGAQDLENRGQGIRVRTRQLMDRAMHREEGSDDQVLEARVRSALGRVISKPHAVSVSAEEGTVTLRGEVYQDEITSVVRRVRSVPGVDQVVDQLDVLAENAPAYDPLESRGAQAKMWSPAWRLAAMAGGGFLTLYGMKKRGLIGTAGASLGGTLLNKALNRQA